MANTFESNFTRKVAMKVLSAFESNRTLSKNVNTQLVSGAFNPNSGTQVDIKRPTDYTTIRDAAGDISTTRSDIITGKATATVQDYITVAVDYNEVDEALKMGTDMSRFWDDIARRIVVDLELDFAAFALKNLGLSWGTTSQGVNNWKEIANTGAFMQSMGVPMNKDWCYFLNPFSQASLSSEQRSIGADNAFSQANSNATVVRKFAGFNVMTATTLPSFTQGTLGGDLAGVVGAIDVTYNTAKDTMTQSIPITGIGTITDTITAGSIVEITGRNHVNLSTRQAIKDETGTAIKFRGVVTTDAALTAGAGTLTVTGPLIWEAAGAYNTTDTALTNGDVITILHAADTVFQPNLFWHPDALCLASVPIKKLHSTDTLATTADGLQLRVSKFSDGAANKQTVRFDLHPAYGVMNPFFGGQGYGVA